MCIAGRGIFDTREPIKRLYDKKNVAHRPYYYDLRNENKFCSYRLIINTYKILMIVITYNMTS